MSSKIKKGDSSGSITPNRQLFLPTELDFTFQQLLNSYIKNGLIEKIGAIPFSIWIIIRAYANVSGKDAGKSFVSYSQIQKISGFSTNTIRKSIAELEKEGLIKVFEEHNPKISNSKRYYTVEFIVSENDPTKKIEIPYIPETAAETRKSVQRWVEAGSTAKLPENVFVWQDNRRIQNTFIVVGTLDDAKKLAEELGSSEGERRTFSSLVGRLPWEQRLDEEDKKDSSEE